MNAETTARSRSEIVDEVSKWTVGPGIIAVALFPLALPILILTVIAVLPLIVPLLALGLLAGVVAVPIMLIRKLGPSVSRLRPRRRPTTGEAPPRPATEH